MKSALIILLVVLSLAVLQEMVVFITPLAKRSKHVYFIENPKLHAFEAQTCLTNYDANYYSEYIPFERNLTDWCAIIGAEISTTFRLHFTTVSGIYQFQCKHACPGAPFVFTGPPVQHLLVIIPLQKGRNTLQWNGTKHTFQNSVCITPPGVSTSVAICSSLVALAIVQPFLVWDII
jgi:hypothetical protein